MKIDLMCDNGCVKIAISLSQEIIRRRKKSQHSGGGEDDEIIKVSSLGLECTRRIHLHGKSRGGSFWGIPAEWIPAKPSQRFPLGYVKSLPGVGSHAASTWIDNCTGRVHERHATHFFSFSYCWT